MRDKIAVYVEKLREDIILPKYANENDSGMDIYAAEDIIINPNETKIIPTGIKVAIPEGYEIQIRARSGISLNTPLRMSNCVGTIDSGYRGEIGVIMTNTSFILAPSNCKYIHYSLLQKGNKPGTYIIIKGDRIAQLVLQRIPQIEWLEIDNVKEISNDRKGGFGSTGISI